MFERPNSPRTRNGKPVQTLAATSIISHAMLYTLPLLAGTFPSSYIGTRKTAAAKPYYTYSK